MGNIFFLCHGSYNQKNKIKKMKILHVITSLNNGGAENHLAELASLQAKQNNSSINIVYLRGSDYWVKILKKKKFL